MTDNVLPIEWECPFCEDEMDLTEEGDEENYFECPTCGYATTFYYENGELFADEEM